MARNLGQLDVADEQISHFVLEPGANDRRNYKAELLKEPDSERPGLEHHPLCMKNGRSRSSCQSVSQYRPLIHHLLTKPSLQRATHLNGS
ncbi:hypothetical protein [Sphingomonas xinjiangensis]|uniref:Uncharacterized protein n=1 Tax=Sphingomonas xinjiangensis TaxID=643568 RepID=A0A840YI56_9SPHN|nr:hypothetical protein [Sphingomonas xinjiangensis]MBB5712095.1 hypothetical protein [Sphingomonas xinjiangensis]